MGAITIKQTNYGIQPIRASGGAVRVKNELKIDFVDRDHIKDQHALPDNPPPIPWLDPLFSCLPGFHVAEGAHLLRHQTAFKGHGSRSDLPALDHLGGDAQNRAARALLKKGNEMPAFAPDGLRYIERYGSGVS